MLLTIMHYDACQKLLLKSFAKFKSEYSKFIHKRRQNLLKNLMSSTDSFTPLHCGVHRKSFERPPQ